MDPFFWTLTMKNEWPNANTIRTLNIYKMKKCLFIEQLISVCLACQPFPN